MNTFQKIKLKLLNQFGKKISLQTAIYLLHEKISQKKLTINGKEFPYLFHSYNNYGITERTAEIPIVFAYLKSRNFKHVLEIGNVTNYYEDYFVNAFNNKTVVDKIEHNYNVITKDIAEFSSEQKFDFIFSISTFEHMDSDLGRNPDYKQGSSRLCSVAADNIVHCYENLLAENGLLLVTAPIGYTPEWDLTFKSDCLDKYPFKSLKKIIFKRTGDMEWIQLDSSNMDGSMAYGSPFPYANYISVFEIRK